jgi:hypothetical protein
MFETFTIDETESQLPRWGGETEELRVRRRRGAGASRRSRPSVSYRHRRPSRKVIPRLDTWRYRDVVIYPGYLEPDYPEPGYPIADLPEPGGPATEPVVPVVSVVLDGQTMPGGSVEADEEIGHAHMGERNISLKWLSRPGHTGDRYLFPIKDAMAALRSNQGGVYILVGDAPANVSNNAVRCSTCIKDCVLKVGIAEEFRSRFGAYLKPGHAWPKGCQWTNLRVYMAEIGGFYSLDRYVERALDRLLRRQGYALPASRPVPPQPVNARVVIHNVLPTSSTLLASVRKQVAQNRLPLAAGTAYEFAAPDFRPCSCQSGSSCASNRACKCGCSGKPGGACNAGKCGSCGSAPCRCRLTQCAPSCSCNRCKQARSHHRTGRWSRRGNQLELMGV